MSNASRWRQYGASFVLVILVWQVMSHFFPPFLVPSVPRVAAQVWEIITERGTLLNAGATFARIVAGLLLSFLFGFLLGLWMALYRPAADLLRDIGPAQIAELRARILETMATMKQAAEPWHSDGGIDGNSRSR